MMRAQVTNQTISKLERRSKKFQIAANIATILAMIVAVFGIYFSVNQYIEINAFNKTQMRTSETREKRKNAIEAIDKIYNREFLDKLAAIYDDRLEDDERFKAFNLVFNTYYIVSVIFNDTIGDRSIIAKSIEYGIKEFTKSNMYINNIHTMKDLCKDCVDEIEKMKESIDKKE